MHKLDAKTLNKKFEFKKNAILFETTNQNQSSTLITHIEQKDPLCVLLL